MSADGRRESNDRSPRGAARPGECPRRLYIRRLPIRKCISFATAYPDICKKGEMKFAMVLALLACVGAVIGGHHGHEYNIPVHGYNPKIQLLGEHVDLPEIPSKVIRVTKTVAVHVPVPYPVKIKQNVPYPVHVAKPYPVPVPHIIRVPQPAPQPTKPVEEQVYEPYPPQNSYVPQQQVSFVPQQTQASFIPQVQGHFQAAPEAQFHLQSSGDEGNIGGGYGSSFQGSIGPFHQEAAAGGGQSFEGSDDGSSYGGPQGGSSYGGGSSYSGDQGGSSYGGDQGGSSYGAAGDSDGGHSPSDGGSYDSEYQSYDNAIQNYHQSHPQNSGYDSYSGSAGKDLYQGQQELHGGGGSGHGGY